MSQVELYRKVFSLPLTGKSVHGNLSLASRAKNRLQYGKEVVTFKEREDWVKETVPDKMQALWLKKIQREHILQLRELHPDKKDLLANFLRTQSKNVLKSMPGTVLD